MVRRSGQPIGLREVGKMWGRKVQNEQFVHLINLLRKPSCAHPLRQTFPKVTENLESA